MLNPRWRKVLRDLSSNRTRTLLVIASIAVGIFAVGTVQQLRTVILRQMQAVYDVSSPAHATIIADNLDDEILESVRRMPQVAAAEGRNSLNMNIEVEPGRVEPFTVTAIDNFEEISINLLRLMLRLDRHPEFGADGTRWPTKNEVILERSSLDSRDALPASLQVGDSILLETEAGKRRDLTVTGAVYDASTFPATFTGRAYGYVTFETFERLGGSKIYSQLNIQANGTPEQLLDEEYITQIANEVGDKIEKSGRTVQRIQVPDPGELIFQDIFDSIALLLTPLGLLALLLSGFLGRFRTRDELGLQN